jgi:hypothetical protein
MVKKLILSGFMSSLLLLSIISYSLPAFAQGPDSNGKPEVVGISGIVPGKDLIVHVLVVVNPDEDRNQKALAALALQGARPFAPHEFSLLSLKWDQFGDGNSGNDFVAQYYNTNNAPVPRTAWTNTHDTWNGVTTSNFEYFDAGNTNRCPSLVQECKGPQKFDGNNDVAWMKLNSPSTLGVTWTGTSIDEADMALNTSFNWNGGYDAETVILHENGHALGLGHSQTTDAIMYAYYQGIDRNLHQDDINGITELYPNDITVTQKTLTGITISPVNSSIEVGSFTQFTAKANYDDNTSVDVTNDVTWSSSNDSVATISATGLAEGIIEGSVTIAADYDGKSDNTNLTISPATETPTSVVGTVSYSTEGGKYADKHLIITVNLNPSISEASVNITLYRDGAAVGSATGATNSNGVVGFSLKNAQSGDYSTIINSVIVNSQSLSIITDDPGLSK